MEAIFYPSTPVGYFNGRFNPDKAGQTIALAPAGRVLLFLSESNPLVIAIDPPQSPVARRRQKNGTFTSINLAIDTERVFSENSPLFFILFVEMYFG